MIEEAGGHGGRVRVGSCDDLFSYSPPPSQELGWQKQVRVLCVSAPLKEGPAGNANQNMLAKGIECMALASQLTS